MPDNTPHVPTDITRAEVSALTSFGNTQQEICLYLDIALETLYKYYRRELDTAVTKSNAMVAKRLFNKAVNQDDLSAQVFWLKTRARWRTTDKEEDKINVEQLADVVKRVNDLNKASEKDY